MIDPMDENWISLACAIYGQAMEDYRHQLRRKYCTDRSIRRSAAAKIRVLKNDLRYGILRYIFDDHFEKMLQELEADAKAKYEKNPPVIREEKKIKRSRKECVKKVIQRRRPF